MKTSRGFINSVIVLALSGLSLMLLAGTGALLVHTRSLITGHHNREQAVLHAYACISYAMRAHTSGERVTPPLTLYAGTSPLCRIVGLRQTSPSLHIQVEVAARVLQAEVPLSESVIIGTPLIVFTDK